jgi:hypothetical protein
MKRSSTAKCRLQSANFKTADIALRSFFTLFFGVALFGFGLTRFSAALGADDSTPAAESPKAETPKSDLPRIVGIRVGFADCYKAGLWTTACQPAWPRRRKRLAASLREKRQLLRC